MTRSNSNTPLRFEQVANGQEPKRSFDLISFTHILQNDPKKEPIVLINVLGLVQKSNYQRNVKTIDC